MPNVQQLGTSRLIPLLFSFFSLNIIGYSPVAAQPVILDSVEVSHFMDGLMTAQLKGKHIAGATLAVVQKGRFTYTRGYGYADVEKKKPVDGRTTMFRIGSISKLFVWTSVMQLAARGKLDLKADVNTYCKGVRIPDAFGKPITLLDLMNHAPGFEDKVIGLFAKGPEGMKPLEAVLNEQLPERIWAPGRISSYSNYGTALAAYIVTQVSGMSWDEYVEKNIFKPLEMGRSTFRQPVPDSLSAHLSKGYRFDKGRLEEGGFEYIPLSPAGSVSASAADMARFMRAHLNWGRLGAVRILDSLSAVEMRQPTFRHSPTMNPIRHGFIDGSQKGQEIFGHGGDTELFHSDLVLLPEHGIGIFLSFNSMDGSGVREKILEAFLERFFPAPKESDGEKAKTGKAASLAGFKGVFRSNRFCRNDLSKLASLSGQVNLHIDEDGTFETQIGGRAIRWVPVGELLFQEKGGEEQLSFRTDDQGNITHFFLSRVPVIAFERVPFVEQTSFNIVLLAASVLILCIALVGWPLGAWFRVRYDVRTVRVNLMPAISRWTAWFAVLGMVLFLTGFALQVSAQSDEIVYGIPSSLTFWLKIPWVLLPLHLAVLWFALQLWGLGKARLSARIGYTLVFFAIVSIYGFLYLWKWMG
ncbi:MAG: serine hydrolase domain-containing protein [Haliscomenobacter sp.]